MVTSMRVASRHCADTPELVPVCAYLPGPGSLLSNSATEWTSSLAPRPVIYCVLPHVASCWLQEEKVKQQEDANAEAAEEHDLLKRREQAPDDPPEDDEAVTAALPEQIKADQKVGTLVVSTLCVKDSSWHFGAARHYIGLPEHSIARVSQGWPQDSRRRTLSHQVCCIHAREVRADTAALLEHQGAA